eukprot:15338232-Ditylum_brightwellii.AAC.1
MKQTWLQSKGNELIWLLAGIPGKVTGLNTIGFIPHTQVPRNKKVMYTNVVCDYHPLEDNTYRACLNICGDKLPYHGETVSPAANLLESKLILNSIILDTHKGA